ncbi:MAG: glycerate kinase [Elusimicrobiota bacterium]|jgi:glycerate kinase|nr:glycerate kinase [Elusimicrobiota bacterium]
MQKILLMPNAFKGSLSAGDFCRIAAKTLRGKSLIKCCPVSDGGDGIIEVFKTLSPKSKLYFVNVIDAVYKKHKAPFLILPDGKTCIIETAKVCGLAGISKEDLNPLGATSFGIGQVILAAAKKGAKTFFIGLGGVACNDGGAGMAMALGFELLDDENSAIPLGASGLLSLAKIKSRPQFLKKLKFIGLSDVKNPLLGKNGSAAVYGPQKGANKKEVATLEKSLKNYARVVKKDFGLNINVARAGAAGAIASGILGLLNGKLEDGAPFILNQLKAEALIKKANFVIATEGQLDEQTFYGKAPQAVCLLAKKHRKPVVFICGVNKIKNKKLLKKNGNSQVFAFSDYAKNKEDSIKNASYYLKKLLQIFGEKF